MNKSLFQLLSIHFKEFYREPGVIFWGIFFPILMAWGLGIAFTQKKVMIQKIAFVEENASPNLRFRQFIGDSTFGQLHGTEYTKQIKNETTGTTKYVFVPVTWVKALIMLKKGEVNIIIKESVQKIEYHYDPFNTEAKVNYLQLTDAMENCQDLSGVNKVVPMTDIGSRYIDFLIPGLISMGVMMSIMWGISYSMIEKRKLKLLRRMIATPMYKSTFLFSMIIARIVLCYFEATLLYLFSHFVFQIRIEGNIGALIFLFTAGNVAFTGLAILVSSRTSNTQIGNGLINAIVTPMMMLSGIFFSYHNFPDYAFRIIENLPLTMLADGIRSIFIEGAGFAQIIIPAAVLSSFGFICFIAGLKIYKWY